ncbi:MAG TPA: signal peptidase I [Xanthomonadaceae bacterium]|jgi:signal peptidase I
MRYDFTLLFTALTLLSGAIWLIDALFFARGRRKTIAAEQAAVDQATDAAAGRVRTLITQNRIAGIEVGRNADGIGIGVAHAADVEKLRALITREMPELDVQPEGDGLQARLHEVAPMTREPVLFEYSRSLFPVFLVILLVRSFLGEPYRIPSESMMPNLLIGDFILVNKFAYGLRLPVLDTKVVKVGEPQRGDVIVFHPPMAPDEVWIKRVIGVPGDVIDYHGYQLTINGQPVPSEAIGPYVGQGSGSNQTGTQVVRENLPGRTHTVLESGNPPTERDGTWTVPPGEYFMMGDNRDDSADSRFWPTHFLPEANIVGKAEVVWMNLDWDARKMDSSRIGTIIR